MPQNERKTKEEDKPNQPESLPLIIPVLPNDEFILVPSSEEPPPEPIEAPGDPRGQEPMDETPDQPTIYV